MRTFTRRFFTFLLVLAHNFSRPSISGQQDFNLTPERMISSVFLCYGTLFCQDTEGRLQVLPVEEDPTKQIQTAEQDRFYDGILQVSHGC